MTAVARDEVEHLATVVKIIARRGGKFSRMHRNPYASALRNTVRLGQGPDELADRLMVSALIEARSCERFYLLAEGVDDEQLRRLYRNLWASEAGHYRIFIDLALQLETSEPVQDRWHEMLDIEAELIATQPPGPRIHGGVE
jgi:tRNA-(ms[2]io[6]A)-hydroxylase